LDDFAGFHGEIGKGPRTDIVYANVYHTDKTPTYQLHKGVFRFRTGEDLYPSKIQQFLKDINTMTEIFIACVGDEDAGQPPQEGCTRLELRVPLNLAQSILLDPPVELLREVTYMISPLVWWYVLSCVYMLDTQLLLCRNFKFFRTTALYVAINRLRLSNSRHRITSASLTFGGILIYMLNGIHMRQGESSAALELARACCMQ
ncbi:hypothetical protein BC834DRAFT_808622, partial [Gloeopeniophorella convolvens]